MVSVVGVLSDVVLGGVFLSDDVEFVLSHDLSPELACAPWLVSSACWGLLVSLYHCCDCVLDVLKALRVGSRGLC